MALQENIAQAMVTHEKLHLLAAIVRNSNDAITVQDFQGNITLWNAAAERIYGYTEAEALKMNIRQVVPPEKRPETILLLERLARAEKIQSFETQRITKDGTILDVWIAVALLTDASGNPIACATTERDITKRKQLEKELLASTERERKEIGQEMHDNLGQILTGIAVKSKGLELKLKGKSLAESTDAAEICNLANRLIAQTRHLARMLYPVDLEGGGLVSALRTLAANTRSLLKTSCRFECRNAPAIDDPAAARHIYRIAQEAVTNAVKHGKAVNITIDLSSTPDNCVLRVKNDGRNFPKVLLRKTGLGLRIMGYRAEMIGGTLNICKGAKGGTVVTCLFPNRNTQLKSP